MIKSKVKMSGAGGDMPLSDAITTFRYEKKVSFKPLWRLVAHTFEVPYVQNDMQVLYGHTPEDVCRIAPFMVNDIAILPWLEESVQGNAILIFKQVTDMVDVIQARMSGRTSEPTRNLFAMFNKASDAMMFKLTFGVQHEVAQ